MFEDFRSSVAPVIAFLVLCNIVGFFGNCLVLYIFSFRYRKNCHRCIVIALSIVDFTSCCTTVPMETVSTWYWFDAPSIALCKVKNFCVQLSALSAMYMLFCTSVYKYRRICKPFRKQVSQKIIIILCLIGTAAAAIFAIPATIIWDINNHTDYFNNSTKEDYICEVRRSYSNTQYPTIYRHFLSSFSVFLFTAIILYILVAKTTYQHFRRMKRYPTISSQASVRSFSSISAGTPKLKARKSNMEGVQQIHDTSVELANAATNEKDRDQSKSVNNHQGNGTESDESSKKATDINSSARSHLSRHEIRTVLIMLIIAGTFSVTFLLGLSLGYIFATRTYSNYSSTSELLLFFAFYRLYFINYAMNPVVYFALDRHFHQETIKLFDSVKDIIMQKCCCDVYNGSCKKSDVSGTQN